MLGKPSLGTGSYSPPLIKMLGDRLMWVLFPEVRLLVTEYEQQRDGIKRHLAWLLLGI